MMEGASFPERTYDYAYANPVEITPPSLISHLLKTGHQPFMSIKITKTRTILMQRTAYLLKVRTIALRMNVIERTNIVICL